MKLVNIAARKADNASVFTTDAVPPGELKNKSLTRGEYRLSEVQRPHDLRERAARLRDIRLPVERRLPRPPSVTWFRIFRENRRPTESRELGFRWSRLGKGEFLSNQSIQ
jgi:hypothetical protein